VPAGEAHQNQKLLLGYGYELGTWKHHCGYLGYSFDGSFWNLDWNLQHLGTIKAQVIEKLKQVRV